MCRREPGAETALDRVISSRSGRQVTRRAGSAGPQRAPLWHPHPCCTVRGSAPWQWICRWKTLQNNKSNTCLMREAWRASKLPSCSQQLMSPELMLQLEPQALVPGVSDPRRASHPRSWLAVNAAQHKVVDLLKTLWEGFFFCFC